MSMTLALVTTARSDYSTMYPVMRAAIDDSDINAKVFCGGMHLLSEFGSTYQQLLEDDIEISEKIDFFILDQGRESLAKSLSIGVEKFSQAIVKHNIDMILVSGDRIENLALYCAATCLRIPICHLCGGDITEGAFDNQVRHTMTKLSHLHMVSMREHYDRVIQMGEEPWRVTITGDAALDTVNNIQLLTREQLFEYEGIPKDNDLLLCTFHPLTIGSENFRLQFDNLLYFLSQQPEIPIITYPNIDPGFEELVSKLHIFSNERPDLIIKKSFTRQGYYSMMHHAKYMIGNSSSGIWEAPSFHLPCINIGGRQSGRKRSCNVVDISGNSINEFRSALEKIYSSSFQKNMKNCHNPYGEGRASDKIIDVIKNTQINDKLLIKKFFQIENPIEHGVVYG